MECWYFVTHKGVATSDMPGSRPMKVKGPGKWRDLTAITKHVVVSHLCFVWSTGQHHYSERISQLKINPSLSMYRFVNTVSLYNYAHRKLGTFFHAVTFLPFQKHTQVHAILNRSPNHSTVTATYIIMRYWDSHRWVCTSSTHVQPDNLILNPAMRMCEPAVAPALAFFGMRVTAGLYLTARLY
jgi:hypothetical protein